MMIMNIFKWIYPSKSLSLSAEYIDYVNHAYPSNHTYKIRDKKLIPRRKLKQRYQKIRALLPDALTSLADVGCSKGFFVFAAGANPSCERSVGIDINQYDISFCHEIKKYLANQNTQFALLKLDEFAERINEYGGSFQTVLLLNIYQYLYFGSDRFSGHYLDHDRIFSLLRKICHGRLIFSNRVELKDCQNEDWVKLAGTKSIEYSETMILKAASNYFSIQKHGAIGRYPLWALDAK